MAIFIKIRTYLQATKNSRLDLTSRFTAHEIYIPEDVNGIFPELHSSNTSIMLISKAIPSTFKGS